MTRLFSEDAGEFEKHKFLCGHDERDWFIARIPENRPVSNVVTAKESLKPELVLAAQSTKQLGTKNKNRRHNEAFIRQGEWFFIPAPEIEPAKWLVIENEPLIRGRGKPHTAEYLYRISGSTLYINADYPEGLTQNEYNELVRQQRAIKWKFRQNMRFQVRRSNPIVHVKGRITHADHKTVLLDGWHRVVPNMEPNLDASGQLVTMGFLD